MMEPTGNGEVFTKMMCTGGFSIKATHTYGYCEHINLSGLYALFRFVIRIFHQAFKGKGGVIPCLTQSLQIKRKS